MIVVSDTTPIHYLALLDLIEILPKHFGEVFVPEMVVSELQAEKTPATVKDFVASRPNWLKILPNTGIIDPELYEIDAGEREAILLAEELRASVILIDDKAGRRMARERGLNVVGTLGILEIASMEGTIDFRLSISRIKELGFFISNDLEQFFLKRLKLD